VIVQVILSPLFQTIEEPLLSVKQISVALPL
jgi:hypothetical protein